MQELAVHLIIGLQKAEKPSSHRVEYRIPSVLCSNLLSCSGIWGLDRIDCTIDVNKMLSI